MKHVGKTGRALLLAAALLLGLLALPMQTQAAKKVGLSRTSLALKVGESSQLKLKNAPKGKNVKWSSSKKAVAAVSQKGKVTAKKAGEAKVTAAIGKKKYTCTVTVTAADGKNASDVAALKKVIREQKAKGADIPEDFDDQTHYIWDEYGRVIYIMWKDCGLTGDLSLGGLTGLYYLICQDNELTGIDVSGCGELDRLDCQGNELARIDVSKCKALDWLNCSDNFLTTLKLDECTKLTRLYCNVNQLTDLKVNGFTKLTHLDCAGNALTSLDVSKCRGLVELSFGGNRLTEMDVSGYTALEVLECRESQLTSLNVSGCKSLKKLDCKFGQVTSLDVSGCSALEELDCDDVQMKSLNVSGCSALKKLDCRSNQLTSLDLSGCPYFKEGKINATLLYDEGVAVTWGA